MTKLARIGRLFTASCLLVLACESQPSPDAPQAAPPPPATPPQAVVEADQTKAATIPTTQGLSCETLRARGHEDSTEAGLYVILCPAAPANARELRAALQLVTDPAATATVLEHPTSAPDNELAELRALARLATEPPTRFAPPTDDETPLPPADEAVLTPLGNDVLVLLAHATRRLSTGGLSGPQRLEARGIVARIHLDAMRALGLDPSRELTPLGRRLAGPTLAHALAFCRGYWGMGGRRLNARAKELEMAMLELVRSVDRTPPHELDAQLTDAHHQAWRYLRARDVRRRVSGQLARREKRALGFESPAELHGVESLAPFPRQLERLVLAGLADLAVEEALRVARAKDGYGMDPVEAHLLELLGRHGFAEAEDEARRAFERMRGERRAPPGLGPEPYELESTSAWTPLPELRERFDQWAQRAATSEGLQRSHAIARANLLLYGRPDLRAALAAEADELPPELAGVISPRLSDDEDAVRRRRSGITRERKGTDGDP